MIDLDLDRLKETFQNWQVMEHSEKEIVFVSAVMDNEKEISRIVGCLYTHILDKKWRIEIEGRKITVRSVEKAKYCRLYTSGCFDVFHYGHLNILAKSKELCDYLIVGVSTDELIEKEKGRKPMIPFEERVKVIQSIGIVDEVIPQIDKNKQKIVDTYNIDAISVGDDWKGRYPKVSCAMEYFKYTKNVSSTILKDALDLNAR